MIAELPDDVCCAFREAGWYSGRNIQDVLSLPEEFDTVESAVAILFEFGMLKVFRNGPGITCAKCDVNLDPNLAEGLKSEVDKIFNCLNLKLYPLGEACLGSCLVWMDGDGRVYLTGVGDYLVLKGESFGAAMHNLFVGIKGKIISLKAVS